MSDNSTQAVIQELKRIGFFIELEKCGCLWCAIRIKVESTDSKAEKENLKQDLEKLKELFYLSDNIARIVPEEFDSLVICAERFDYPAASAVVSFMGYASKKLKCLLTEAQKEKEAKTAALTSPDLQPESSDPAATS